MNAADVTVDTFTPLIGTTFQIRAANGEVTAELTAVHPSPHPVPDGFRSPFSLVWSGPPEPGLQQGVHLVSHPELPGELELFLVPIGATDTAVEYQSVFA